MTHQPPARPKVIAVGLAAAIVASGAANTVIAVIGRAAGAHDDFGPLTLGAYLFFTVLGVLAGAAGWALVRRYAARPREVLTWLVPAVVAISTIPDLVMLASDYEDHANGVGVAALIAMHLVTAAIAVLTYQRILVRNEP